MASKHGGVEEISRRAIGAVAMLGVGDVPERLMRRVVHECVANGVGKERIECFIFEGGERRFGEWGRRC